MRHSFSIPYSISLSKNQALSYGKGKVFRKNPADRDAISYLCMTTRNQWRKDKIFVHIHVHRPDMKADPANFQDEIIDGVKAGIGIDDNLYETSITWELDKTNPHINITIAQEEQEDHGNGNFLSC